MMKSQPALFAPNLKAAEVPADVAELAGAMPKGLYLGTSSWTTPGWVGTLWAHPATESDLAQEGLAVYAQHPLMRTVSVDRSYYAPVPLEDYQRYASQVPEDFRFVVKAQDVLGKGDDPRFLDAFYALDNVVGPAREGLGDKLGVILFQLPPQPAMARWPERLSAFLSALPPGRYSVEPRFRGAMGPGYADALKAGGAAHCVSVHPSMPDLRTQWRDGGVKDAPFLMLRWNLQPGLDYEGAKADFAPFDRLQAEDPDRRLVLAKAAAWAIEKGKDCYFTANNKAEGCSPLSVVRMAEQIRELL